MSRRNSHVEKTPQHRQAYRRYIETVDYEPTVEENVNFQQTSQTGQELRAEPTEGKRPSTIAQQLSEHVRSNWPVGALALIGIAIVYLLYDSKVASARLSSQLESQQTQLGETRACARDSEKRNQEQDIKLTGTEVRLDLISKAVDETRAEVKDIRKEMQAPLPKKPQQRTQ